MSTPRVTTAEYLKEGHHIRITLPDEDSPEECVVLDANIRGDSVIIRTGPVNTFTVPYNHEVLILKRLHPYHLNQLVESLWEDYGLFQ